MPIYEYHCSDCGKTFETTQRITEDALKECILCGGKNVKRLISATAFVLKGGGWYKTDYASGASTAGAGSKGLGSETKSESGSTETPKAEPAKSEPAAAAPAAPPTTKGDS